MKVFLEIIKEQTQEEIEKGVPAEQIIIDVSGKTEEEIMEIKQSLINLLGWSNFKAFKHICHHDETEPKPCERLEV